MAKSNGSAMGISGGKDNPGVFGKGGVVSQRKQRMKEEDPEGYQRARKEAAKSAGGATPPEEE